MSKYNVKMSQALEDFLVYLVPISYSKAFILANGDKKLE